MSDESKQSGGLQKHGLSLIPSAFGATVGTLLYQVANSYWIRKTHHEISAGSAEWIRLSGPWVVAILFGVIGWIVGKAVHRYRHRTPPAKGDRLAIYIAEFGDDADSESARRRVVGSIQRELGTEHVQCLPAGKLLRPRPGVEFTEGVEWVAREARKLLQRNNGDLLIWGILNKDTGSNQLELHFVGAPSGMDGTDSLPLFSPSKDNTLTLDENFGPAMSATLAAFAATKAASLIGDGGRFVADVLRPLEAKLQGLAINVPPSMSPAQRGSFFFTLGLLAVDIGEQSGDSSALERSISAYNEALQSYTRESFPMDWAMIQSNLGNVTRILGERENSIDLLKFAVQAYSQALQVCIRENVPHEWAAIQHNLGIALASLGGRENSTERLELAVQAYTESLQERTRERFPFEWATTQNSLGNTLRALGERENSTERLELSIRAHREALKEKSRERVALSWAASQCCLGAALCALGIRTSDVKPLRLAVKAYRQALKVYTPKIDPLNWAGTRNNLGIVLNALGQVENNTKQLELAVQAFTESLTVNTRESAHFQWASTQYNLGKAHWALGERESGVEHLQLAMHAFTEALKELTESAAPYHHEIVQQTLDSVQAEIESRQEY